MVHPIRKFVIVLLFIFRPHLTSVRQDMTYFAVALVPRRHVYAGLHRGLTSANAQYQPHSALLPLWRPPSGRVAPVTRAWSHLQLAELRLRGVAADQRGGGGLLVLKGFALKAGRLLAVSGHLHA